MVQTQTRERVFTRLHRVDQSVPGNGDYFLDDRRRGWRVIALLRQEMVPMFCGIRVRSAFLARREDR